MTAAAQAGPDVAPQAPAGAAAEVAADAPPPRLDPRHYEPARVPAEVRRHAGTPDTLGVGRPGKVGLLELAFEKIGARTELTGHYQKSPLQIMRPLYYDPARPDLAVTLLMSTGGGILQADRLRTDLHCGADTAVHLTTQAATKVYRMEFDYATQLVNLHAGPRAYVEYLPEPVIPFVDSRLYQRTVLTVDPTATVLAGETVLAGRLARGERNAYRVFASDLEVRRPDGRLVALDTVRLEPGAPPGRPPGAGVTGPAVLAGHDVMASLYAITPLAPATQVADTLHEALADRALLYGVSVLPHDAGAWLRVLGDDTRACAAALRTAWDAVRRLLIGAPAPDLRKT
ncbi:urease accessory protein UreD [Streptomyces sp. SP17BM10]|uniref:urease accessory protein UreD n=1 Tax=Streptomyces sp. SP17BM10 TaxID=3002530 RepID=UPI002E7938C2|nr:urease accessory protein UreD [Streptomyces sp. SP17BM10]MEE1787649.1 urease accessory protein UreD [Streptomyces sp. SP17BM10]